MFKNENEEALHNAILKAGSQTKLAKLAGVEQPAVSYWVNRWKHIPIDSALKIATNSAGTEKEFFIRELRPDKAREWESILGLTA